MRRLSDRQQDLIQALLKHRDGLGIDELVKVLGITRTAVNQHLAPLERQGFVKRGDLRRTAGRPSNVYQLTDDGLELFPKQYPFMTSLLLNAIRKERGGEGATRFLRDIAMAVYEGMKDRFASKSGQSRLEEAVKVMNEIDYNARLETKDGHSSIVASNCVFLSLTRDHAEVCTFDEEFVSKLAGQTACLKECIATGGKVCRFELAK